MGVKRAEVLSVSVSVSMSVSVSVSVSVSLSLLLSLSLSLSLLLSLSLSLSLSLPPSHTRSAQPPSVLPEGGVREEKGQGHTRQHRPMLV